MIPPFFPAPSPAAGLLPVPSGTVRADNGCLPPHPLRCGAPKRLHRAPATALSAYRPLSKDCAFGYSSFSLLFLIVLCCTASYRQFFLWILVVPLHIGGFSYGSWSCRSILAVFLMDLGRTASYRRFFLWILVVPLHIGGLKICAGLPVLTLRLGFPWGTLCASCARCTVSGWIRCLPARSIRTIHSRGSSTGTGSSCR